jgi:hypothetical protein
VAAPLLNAQRAAQREAEMDAAAKRTDYIARWSAFLRAEASAGFPNAILVRVQTIEKVTDNGSLWRKKSTTSVRRDIETLLYRLATGYWDSGSWNNTGHYWVEADGSCRQLGELKSGPEMHTCQGEGPDGPRLPTDMAAAIAVIAGKGYEKIAWGEPISTRQ